MENSLRILSGMRPTGSLHLGHYHGAIKNWVNLQYEYECYFMVADIHALTTNYESTRVIASSAYEMVVDWLACGVDPSQAVIFIQSEVPAHAQLHLLLSMITPLSWLERVPTYKELIEKLSTKDLGTYGFLGYPLLQSADILLYNSKFVPVGEDQVSHVELTREIARRFNYIYGREAGFEEKAREVIPKLGNKRAALYEELLIQYQQEGALEALEKARFLLKDAVNLSLGERERLFAFLENKSRVILTEPQALTTAASKLPGLDGQKMSKSYNNTLMLREDFEQVNKKIKSMQTDPARIRRTDPGDPEKCPVWQLHKVYSNTEVKEWVQIGCTTAGIGCLDCKKPLIESIQAESAQFKERAKPYLEDHNLVRNILADGAEKAIETTEYTLSMVKLAMGIKY
ncbi:MAG: tryptophan--tRNA ligase [Burkholderiales bacterium]|jgi:tryptophanyl-tRNA synthetase|nr:tryptophan--tRNA ligase [Burkholderiales bacterium]